MSQTYPITVNDLNQNMPRQALRERVDGVISNPRFGQFIMVVIIINAVTLGLETNKGIQNYAGNWLYLFDKIVVAIFTVELALKLYVQRGKFFKSGWNIFDTLIVSVAYLPVGGGFAVLRALRILRVLRLLSVVPRMRQVVGGLISAIPAMGSVILLLMLTFYIASVMTTKLFGDAFPQWFGSIGASLYSLFQIMTLESWSMGIVRPVMEVYPLAWLFFVPFVLVASFIVLNLFIAIIVNSMHEEQDEESQKERDMILTEVRAMREQLNKLHDEMAKSRGPSGSS
jgi:voltage-gated sodium channel